MMRAIFILIFLWVGSFLYAQTRAKQWYFGNGAGLDFSSGEPLPVKGSLYTNEGCAVACDNTGNLLFYTNGVNVWDKTHKIMRDGTDLKGSYSATQVVIIPFPGNKNRFYVFTVADQGAEDGLRYSVIDMSLNGGYGAVTIKNMPLLTPVSEKLAVVQHCNGRDFWLISHKWNANSFYSFLITPEGVDDMIISRVGAIHKDEGSGNSSEAIGYLKASFNGKKLACAINKKKEENLELFDFDNSSGKVSNKLSLTVDKNVYGLCFSPDNSKLYVSFDTGLQGILQFDLGAKDMKHSAILIGKSDFRRYGGMQVGPDGKIYVAVMGTFIDVINNPNGKGADCAYMIEKIDLGGRYSSFAMPDVSFHLASSADILGRDTTICTIPYTLTSALKGERYQWSTGEVTESIQVRNSGKYWVKVVNGKCSLEATDSINIKVRKLFDIDLGPDTSLCTDNYTLKIGKVNGDILWSTGERGNSILIDKSNRYSVIVKQENCSVLDEVIIEFIGKPAFVPLTEFSPDGDGFNDTFDYITRGMDVFELKVFNNKGKKVFETTNPRKKWDGKYKNKIAKNGNYTWEVNYKSRCLDNKTYTIKGSVKLYK